MKKGDERMNIQSYHLNSTYFTTNKTAGVLNQTEQSVLTKESKITRQGNYFTYDTYLKNGMISRIEPTGTIKCLQA